MGISLRSTMILTVSAGRQEVEFDGGTEDEVNTGIQASYTMGSISIQLLSTVLKVLVELQTKMQKHQFY